MKDASKTKRRLLSGLNKSSPQRADVKSNPDESQKMRENNEKFMKAIMQCPIPMNLTTLEEGRFIDANEAFLKLMELKRDEVIGRSSIEIDFIAEQQRSIIFNELNKNGRVENRELQIKTKAGVLKNELFNAVIVSTEEEKYILTVLTDGSERKLMDEAKRSSEECIQRSEKMQALGTLAGGLAHDLNNILGIVVGYAEMLLYNVDKTSSLRPYVMSIMDGGQMAAAVVNDLLTLARRGVSDRAIINLNNVIADCQRSPQFEKLSSTLPAVKIITDLETDLLNISGSSSHLSKTLFNLASNAFDAMQKGGVLTIRTANQYLDRPIHDYDQIQEGDYAVLSVSDTGEGIPANDLKHIFEPFYTKKVMGRRNGLGLAVVWATVKDHNGCLEVESEEGKGSTFTLYFPVTRESITVEQAALPVFAYMGKGESLLIVDDVKEQRDLAAMMLGKLNYSVASVSSGEEAVTYLKEHKVDLMVLDMIMDPGMDGLDTYRGVLAIHPIQKAIIVSGFAESDRVTAAQALGAGEYVKKPYVIEKLGLAVRKELNRKELNRK